MASLYKKKKSPFWFIAFHDSSGKRVNHSTGLRYDDPKQTADARLLKARLDAAQATTVHGPGWEFAAKFISNCSPSEKTKEVYLNRWNWIQLFLAQNHIHGPASVRYAHAQDYVEWRTTWKKRSGKTASRNTAIYEVKTFALIMGEAKKLGLCDANPLVQLKLRKDIPDEKPEITDRELEKIIPALRALPLEKEWMRVAFAISLHTGCRLRETRIPITMIDFDRDIIMFPTPKGGKKRAFTVPMPPEIKPMLTRLRDAGNRHTLEFPFQPSRAWQHFFKSLEMQHLCFHCVRVTFITRLARARVPLAQAMRLVNHASMTVHRIYQRLGVEDLRERPQLYASQDANAW